MLKYGSFIQIMFGFAAIQGFCSLNPSDPGVLRMRFELKDYIGTEWYDGVRMLKTPNQYDLTLEIFMKGKETKNCIRTLGPINSTQGPVFPGRFLYKYAKNELEGFGSENTGSQHYDRFLHRDYLGAMVESAEDRRNKAKPKQITTLIIHFYENDVNTPKADPQLKNHKGPWQVIGECL